MSIYHSRQDDLHSMVEISAQRQHDPARRNKGSRYLAPTQDSSGGYGDPPHPVFVPHHPHLAGVSAAEVLRLRFHHILERYGDKPELLLPETILVAKGNHLRVIQEARGGEKRQQRGKEHTQSANTQG